VVLFLTIIIRYFSSFLVKNQPFVVTEPLKIEKVGHRLEPDFSMI